MAKDTHVNDSDIVKIHYHTIRNLTSPEEKENGVQTHFANVRAENVLQLSTRDNLRSYIAEHNPKKRNKVHQAIERTIVEYPDRFINRNSGLTVTCSKIQVDDNSKVARLTDASIINGAQTQGEIKRVFDELQEYEEDSGDLGFHVRLEINVDPDHQSVVETAIARNTATTVTNISQAGARGHLDDLKKALEKARPDTTIRVSETDQGVLETKEILQYARLLMPESLLGEKSASEKYRVHKYSGQVLADFSEWYENQNLDEKAREKYEFTVAIASQALDEYEYWRSHEGWNGNRLHEKPKKGGRPVRRDKKSGKITWVAPGILFPLFGALSAFVRKDSKNGWIIDKPSIFDEKELIKRAVNQFRALDRDVSLMGRSEAAYDALSIYPETIIKVMQSAKE